MTGTTIKCSLRRDVRLTEASVSGGSSVYLSLLSQILTLSYAENEIVSCDIRMKAVTENDSTYESLLRSCYLLSRNNPPHSFSFSGEKRCVTTQIKAT